MASAVPSLVGGVEDVGAAFADVGAGVVVVAAPTASEVVAMSVSGDAEVVLEVTSDDTVTEDCVESLDSTATRPLLHALSTVSATAKAAPRAGSRCAFT